MTGSTFRRALIPALIGSSLLAVGVGCGTMATDGMAGNDDDHSPSLVADGKQVFRFETFGDEQLWTDKLGMHTVVENNVDPLTALKVGLKVDADALPPGILQTVD